MFDINLLNNPGIQDNKSYNQNNATNKIDRISKITNKDKKTEPSHQNVSWFAYLLTIKDDAPFVRYDFQAYMEKHKIQTRTYFTGNAF